MKLKNKIRMSSRGKHEGFYLTESVDAESFSDKEWTPFGGTLRFKVENISSTYVNSGINKIIDRDLVGDSNNYFENLSKPENWHIKVEHSRRIYGDLIPISGSNWNFKEAPCFKYFGSSRTINEIKLEVHEIQSSEMESVNLSGFLADRYEADENGPSKVYEDSLYLILKLTKTSFEKVLDDSDESNSRSILYIKLATGIYTDFKYSSYASGTLKVLLPPPYLLASDEFNPHYVDITDGLGHQPSTLGYVSEYSIHSYARATKSIRLANIYEKNSFLLRFSIAGELIESYVDHAISARVCDSCDDTEINRLHNFLDDIRLASFIGKDIDQENKPQGNNKIWIRKDPIVAFKEGVRSTNYYVNYDVCALAEEYLKDSWLQSPTLDWILLDMMATTEICAFGEHVKKYDIKGFFRLLGKKDPSLKGIQLWRSMQDVWRELSGTIINQRNVRTAMEKSAAEGAAWDQSMWAIVDRAISKNPAGIFVNLRALNYGNEPSDSNSLL